jgi:hypothetical protein
MKKKGANLLLREDSLVSPEVHTGNMTIEIPGNCLAECITVVLSSRYLGRISFLMKET